MDKFNVSTFKEYFQRYSTNADLLAIMTLDEFTTTCFEKDNGNLNSEFGDISKSKTVKVIETDNYCCVGCNKKASHVTIQRSKNNDQIYIYFWITKKNSYVPLTKDHVIAKTHGGTDAYANLQALCYTCNQDKGDSIEQTDNGFGKYIPNDEYRDNKKKVADFKFTRKRIKRSLATMPWYYRILGVDKYIQQKILDPLKKKGYFNEDNGE